MSYLQPLQPPNIFHRNVTIVSSGVDVTRTVTDASYFISRLIFHATPLISINFELLRHVWPTSTTQLTTMQQFIRVTGRKPTCAKKLRTAQLTCKHLAHIMSCARCGECLPETGARKKLKYVFTPKSAKVLFPSVDSEGILCKTCIDSQKGLTKIVKHTKKRRLTFTPGKSPLRKKQPTVYTPSTSASGSTPSKKTSWKSTLQEAIRRSDYRRVASHLLTGNTAVQEAVLAAVSQVVKQEIAKLSKSNQFSQSLSQDAMVEFSWKKTMEESSKEAPLVCQILRQIFPAPKEAAVQHMLGAKESWRKLTNEEAQDLLDKRIGMVLAMALFTKSPKLNKFVQSCVGVELWRQGCSEKIFKTLNHFGLSLGIDASRGHVDNLGEKHASELCRWKSDIESYKAGSFDDVPKGFAMGWDNVQITSHGKHGGLEGGNKFLIWGMTFGVQNRVGTLQFASEAVTPAMQQSPYSFLPSPDDFATLKLRMVFVVRKILAEHLKVLESITMPKHMPHEKSKEMAGPSHMVSLGVVTANPSSTGGVIQILKHLQQFIPKENENFVPVVCNGDNLSVEKMRCAKRASVTCLSPDSRLDGVEESPQEFHKEALLLQDMMNKYNKGNSITARGTVSNLRVVFGYKRLKHKVMENFKEAWEMMEFCTVGYIVLLALHLRGMESLEDIPEDCPADAPNRTKHQWLRRLAMEVVETCWLPVEAEGIKIAGQTFKGAEAQPGQTIYPFCFCESFKENEPMVRCCNPSCTQEWFHRTCIPDPQPKSEEDWYCSPACEKSSGYIYCFCQKKIPGADLVQCSLEGDCLRKEWYHLVCLGKDATSLPDRWFCCEECEHGAIHDDQVLNYSKGLVWDGLNLLVRRDAVREGDGPAIVSHWKMDMLTFWTNHHNKYFLSGCQLLAGIGGTLPKRLREDLVWNRVANIRGVPGGNIGLDLLNEFMNNDFKEMLKHSRGNYTDRQIQRVAEMSGAYGQQLDKLFSEAGLGDLETKNYQRKRNWFTRDLATLVEKFEKDALFDHIPGRCHKGFEHFSVENRLPSPERMGSKLVQWATELDFWASLSDDLRQLAE